MKQILLLPQFIFLLSCSVSAQFNIASVQDGNFKSPSTWNCNCIPLPVAVIAVNHQVVFDTSFALVTAVGHTGKITIASGASLIQDATSRYLFIDGSGSLINNGKFYCDSLLINNGRITNNDTFLVNTFANLDSITNSAGAFMAVTDSFYTMGKLFNSGKLAAPTFYNGGTIINYNIITGVDSFLNNGTFTNNANGKIYASTFYNMQTFTNKGKILQVDSLTNGGTFLNDVGSSVTVDSMINISSFTNNGVMNINLLGNTGTYTNDDSTYFTDLLSTGTINNNGIFIGTHDVWNAGTLNLNAGSYFFLGNDFLNADSIATDAVTDIEGQLNCKNWYNADVVKGTAGHFLVEDTTWNSGSMIETFDICDATPPAATPFIDLNFGTIAAGITYCSTVAVNEISTAEIKIYPTITDGLVVIETSSAGAVEIISVDGRLMDTKQLNSDYTQLNLSVLNNGIYILKINSMKGNSVGKIVIQK